jgi:peptide/nickel transport system substrate-binding protein
MSAGFSREAEPLHHLPSASRVQSSFVSPAQSVHRRPGRILLGLFLALAFIGIAGCSGASGGTATSTSQAPTTTMPVEVRKGGVLSIAVPNLPASWSPAGPAWSTSEYQAARAIYDRLMVRDQNDKPVGELIERITPNSTFTAWTLELRKGITFSDGAPLDAVTVAANLNLQRLAPAAAELLKPVIFVTAPSELTVVVATAEPWSTFPEVLTTQVGAIASIPTLTGESPTPIGTGPFVHGSVGLDGSLLLGRNATYWRTGLPHLDTVRLVVIAEADARTAAVLDGTVDMVAIDQPRQISLVERDRSAGEKLSILDDRNAEKLKVAVALNTGRPPFDRITARRAFAMATDRTAILTQVYDGQGVISRGIISDTSPWFSDHSAPARDLEGARRQVAEYTDETGEPVAAQMLVPPDVTVTRVATMLRVQLAEAGIDLTLIPVDPAMMIEATTTGQYQSALGVGFAAAHPDAYAPLFAGSPSEQPAVTKNITRYVNPFVTMAFADARSTRDVTRQVDDYRIIQEQMFVDMPMVFIVQQRRVILVSTSVNDAQRWTTGSGATGLGQDASTLSLAQIWKS